jgi:hypothetical protein
VARDTESSTIRGFALVLAIWGSRYGVAHVNAIVAAALRLSPKLDEVVLLTDRSRDGLLPQIKQLSFPPPYNSNEFFGLGYRAKLAVFAAVSPTPGKACVFLDLDTIVIGDLGRIAARVTGPDDILMLPPAGLQFSRVRRWLDRLRGGRTYPVGNSSVLAFHSAADPNLAQIYGQMYRNQALPDGWTEVIDDRLISWFGRGRVRAVPRDCAVMLRREFLSRIPVWPALKTSLPATQHRRALIAAVTMNGLQVKAETLAQLAEGARLSDGRGRHGRWDASGFGELWAPLRDTSRKIVAAGQSVKSD